MKQGKENTPYQGLWQDTIKIFKGMYSIFLHIHELLYYFGGRKMAFLVSGYHLTTNAATKCFVV